MFGKKRTFISIRFTTSSMYCCQYNKMEASKSRYLNPHEVQQHQNVQPNHIFQHESGCFQHFFRTIKLFQVYLCGKWTFSLHVFFCAFVMISEYVNKCAFFSWYRKLWFFPAPFYQLYVSYVCVQHLSTHQHIIIYSNTLLICTARTSETEFRWKTGEVVGEKGFFRIINTE